MHKGCAMGKDTADYFTVLEALQFGKCTIAEIEPAFLVWESVDVSIWLSLVASLAEICHCQLNILCDGYGGKPGVEALSSFGNSCWV